MTSFSLSDFTQVTWLDKGGIQLSRIKEDGENFEQGYKIFLPYQSCKALVRKRNDIHKYMDGIVSQLISSPCNIVLHKSQVMRLSEFYEDHYYGIHTLDTNGGVKIGKGMNLTEGEYEELLSKLILRFPPIPEDSVTTVTEASVSTMHNNFHTPNSKEVKHMKLDISQNKTKMATPVNNIGLSSVTETGYMGPSAADQFSATQFGWSQQNITGYQSNKVSQGGWYFNVWDCYQEAMNFNSKHFETAEEGELVLDLPFEKPTIFPRRVPISLDKQMLDVALGTLLKNRIDLCVQSDQANHIYSNVKDDVVVYGKTLLKDISLSEVFELCLKTINYYTAITPEMNQHLAVLFSDYEKEETIIFSMSEGTLDKQMLDLFSFIFTAY